MQRTSEKYRHSFLLRRRVHERRYSYLPLRRLHLLPGPWIAVDVQSECILDGSRHFEDMMSLDRAEYLHQSISILTAPSQDTLWVMKTFDRNLLNIEGRHEDVLLKSGVGRNIVADVHISRPIRAGRTRAAVCLITDATERHRLQSELIAKHKELRKTFADLEQKSAAMTRMNIEIGEMSAQLSRASSLAAIGEITAELTHQLNNPLAGAVAAARRIDMFLDANVDSRIRDMVPLLKDSLERLRVTTNELKRVYRNSRAADQPMEPVDLQAQVESALMLMQQRLIEVDVQTEMDAEVDILARPVEVQHVIVNLIDNAAHAIRDRGTIRIRSKQLRDGVLFSVEDSGPGIPESQRERIFEPFFTTREQGSGLGLSVVRRNVENNKGVIRVGQSELGGAAFEIGFVSATR